MSLKKVKNAIASQLTNKLGWKTNKKFIVIESDDWGSIRMASKQSYNYLKSKGLPVDKCIYNSNDTLESNEDIEMIFEVLESVTDKNGNPAIITVNNVVANPDFERIKESNFEKYYYEPFNVTIQRYPAHNRVLDLYQEGTERKFFKPQFHGREHINVERWMKGLRTNNTFARMAFDQQMFSVISAGKTSSCRNEYLDAFGGNDNRECINYSSIVDEGCNIFEKIHGYRSSSFIAPCYIWPKSLNFQLLKSGITYLQGGRVQKKPSSKKRIGFTKEYHYSGQKNKLGQIFLIRNASFEVAENPDKDWADSCMSEISNAFKYGKPAIISSHRVNFMGGLNSNNRRNTLKQFKKLLIKITQKWPDAEFMSSDQLGHVIQDQQK